VKAVRAVNQRGHTPVVDAAGFAPHCTELRLLKQLPYDLWRPEATPIDQKRLGSMKSEPVIFIAT